MALEYADVVDIRYNPFANIGQGAFEPQIIGWGITTAERRTVPNSAPYEISLYESPQANLPSTTKITLVVGGTVLFERSRYETPGALEYSIVYYDDLGAGKVRFNAAQAGAEVDINYYGLGTNLQTETLDTLVPIDNAKVINDETDFRYKNIVGSNNLTDTTAKVFAVVCNHYTNAEQDVQMIYCNAQTNSVSQLYIGGGVGEYNAVTNINFFTAANATTTTGTTRMSIDNSGNIILDTTSNTIYVDAVAHEVGILTNVPTSAFDIRASKATASDNLTNVTNKEFQWGLNHYANTEEPVYIIGAESVSGNSIVNIGGGDASFNATEEIRFYTAANHTTVTGTLRGYFDNAGDMYLSNDLIVTGYIDGSNTGVRVGFKEFAWALAGGPNDSELDAAWGDPSTVGAGFFCLSKKSGSNLVTYNASDGNRWYYLLSTLVP